jgi:hypothetical protein
LEIDLSSARRAEEVPPELQAVLPAQRLVNLVEARAVVEALTALVHDKDFRALAGNRVPGHGPAVAVIALYAAQATLLEALCRREPALASLLPGGKEGGLIEVGVPADFQQRECLVAFVSLTRSHTHRAVSYGESPRELVRALTRPAARLSLFGDLGTLARRSQWTVPLDHLDEVSSRREQAVVAGLVSYIQGHGLHPKAFRLQESSNA